ncbi:Hypothetical protein PHPALM_14497 [Phytophthora palmivora]|uniref:PiggyBac transposable element-derived protein domain-containing protein n=1 Tax=Phytophthora palmivora TaxID=4796 RepID=A0A2P4XUI8_9STRA|nr:Hypothetical protein PHPALM_14497 [Phytophthora palmivora]
MILITSDVHDNEDRLLVSLDEFDGVFVLDAMRRERLFGVVGADDVNYDKDADYSCSESDIDDDDNGDFNSSDEGVEDVEEEVNNAEVDCTFDMSADDLREIGESGWQTYDEDHSDVLLDAATDFYAGSSGPTRSAVAFADSPLGMLFHFLPKEMWKLIADESNSYRERNISALAMLRRTKLLERQQKDPRRAVCESSGPIKAHEIVHVIALLFARAVAPIRDGLAGHWR